MARVASVFAEVFHTAPQFGRVASAFVEVFYGYRLPSPAPEVPPEEPEPEPEESLGRTTAELLELLERHLPPSYCGARPLLAGQAAVLAEVEDAGGQLREQGTIEVGAGIWLTLAARGQGIHRATAESDALLRTRMRRVDDQVTPAALRELVDEFIAPDTCVLLEWFEHSYLDVELADEGGLWLDSERLSGGPQSFLLLVPQRGWVSAGAFLDVDFWLDGTVLGAGTEDGLYAAIINAVNRARAAGVFWRLCLTD